MKQIIEINGTKLEVDLRLAKRVEMLTVGTRVKVLKKQYDGRHEVKHGVIIGFEPFMALPTIIVAYMEITYSSTAPTINFLYYNAETKDVEMTAACDEDQAALDKNEIVALFDREIAKKRAEIADLVDRKSFFEAKFATYWTPVDATVPEAI
jgi:hypothetical protein